MSYPSPSVSLGANEVTVRALVKTGGRAGSAFVRFGESRGYLRCSTRLSLPASKGVTPVTVRLSGLIPKARYHFEVGASTQAGTSYGRPETFTAPAPLTVAAGVQVGPITLGGSSRAVAFQRIEEFLAAPLRFAFEGRSWSAPRSTLGARLDPAGAYARALGAHPGSHLKLGLTIDGQRLHGYLASLNARFSHASRNASIRLAGTRAIVSAASSPVELDMQRMTAAVRAALQSGLNERLRLLVQEAPKPSAGSVRAVVVRLGSQTLTAYLNGRPILTAPVTTGRAALPTPVGSYHVIFRASPFVFHSPWPPGSPYWYPPTPVTWAMDFFDGDFLHNDPGEPTGAYGAGSEYGPYASHGCVHVPYAVMAYLYRWLPIGAQVVVAQT